MIYVAGAIAPAFLLKNKEMINLPSTAVTDITGHLSTIFNDLSPIIFLVIGIILATVVIEILIGIFRR